MEFDYLFCCAIAITCSLDHHWCHRASSQKATHRNSWVWSHFLNLQWIHVAAIYIIMVNHRCSTCPLVFGCWELGHVIFLMLRKKELLAKLSNWQLFSLKMVLGCRGKMVVILWICSALQAVFFFLSLRNITWPNYQQPKTRGHVEHLRRCH